MLVIFMVIISSSEKTQASCLRTENVTQKKHEELWPRKNSQHAFHGGAIFLS